jgi:hypothetical protein
MIGIQKVVFQAEEKSASAEPLHISRDLSAVPRIDPCNAVQYPLHGRGQVEVGAGLIQ